MATIDSIYDPRATSIPALRYLVAVAQHRHFGRAATACRVSQPTLSAVLAQWERRMRLRVFERGQGGVCVTAAGERVVAAARAALVALEGVESAARSATPPFWGPVRLGVIPTVAPYLLPLAAPALERAWPDLELPVREATTDELLAGLARGTLDVALLALLPQWPATVAHEPLYHEPFLLAVPRGHRLASAAAGRRGALADDLAGERVLLLDDGHCLRGQALAACRLRDADPRAGADYRAASLETLRELVALGMGVSLLPALAARPDPRIRLLPLREPEAGRDVVLAWRAGDPRAEAYRLLAAPIRRALPGAVTVAGAGSRV